MLRSSSLASASSVSQSGSATGSSAIRAATPATAPNYWSTWYAQNYWIDRGTDLKTVSGLTNAAAREQLTEHAVLNPEDGWATNYLRRGREDYIFLIDHGWQTKDPAKRVAGGPAFFNLSDGLNVVFCQ